MLEKDSHSKTFLGVRFVLFGFDPLSETEVKSKLINGGGVDAVQYSENCTHVIVDKIVYDDAVCVGARNDGKTVVRGLWVDHSFGIGMPVDATSIMYRPLRDLNGIPRAKNLTMCLTGYQRQDRDDIMTMVGLMGAHFSKPLVANRVTHLICYKFEGEKYELANKMKIKLVNHRWLEDCLRNWELLPEDNYSKSGYELEMLEAEAKDSEDEAEGTSVKQPSCENVNKSPQNLKAGTSKSCEMPKTGVVLKVSHNLSEPEGLSRVPGHLDVCGFKGASSNDPPDPKERTPISTRTSNDLEFISRIVERPSHSDAKYNATISYTRRTPRRSPSSISPGNSGNTRGSPKVLLSESVNKSSAKVLNPSVTNADQGSEPTHLVDGPSRINNHSPLGNTGRSVHDKSSMNAVLNSHANSSTAKSSNFSRNMFTEDNAFLANMVLETGENENANKKTPQPSSRDLRENNLVLRSDSGGFVVERHEQMVAEAGEPQNQQQDGGGQFSLKKELEIDKSDMLSDLHVLRAGKDDFITKPVGKKMIAKKTLGSRSKLKSNESQKGSINLNATAAQNDPTVTMAEVKEREEDGNFSDATELETSLATINVAVTEKMETESTTKLGNNIEDKIGFMDDETEAPEEKNDSENFLEEEQADMIDLPHKADTKIEMKLEADNSAAYMHNGPVEGKNPVEIQKRDGSILTEDFVKGKGRKQPSDKTNTTTATSIVRKEESKKVLNMEENLNGKNIEENAAEKESTEPHRAGQGKSRIISRKKSKNSVDAEKENKPAVDGDQYASLDDKRVSETAAKSNKAPVKFNEKVSESNLGSTTGREVTKQVKAEPLWFILSGHRLQRKEHQKVIKSLKGKLCRDSHQWSYQATHYIAPGPIRRTEKFFAAAASGRWILKTDYLTACSQAGRFLAEESYEWHKNGLSEDGTINLEAPRKWRLLRERTGHGAFYGMRIIIYGECMTPPLDTLKRVVKAGDGTILATSPPYTRFLTSGVDFAIISPGITRADVWVQEFLKHKIPCIVADYLVEYVCKPGNSLERHVLYNTNDLAEKSFSNLLSKVKVIPEDLTTSKDCDSGNDIACEVCFSCDRGEDMLICGDECGSVGCGAGIHIDCCDPPLESIPEEDWFCPKCSGSRSTSPKKKRIKKALH
ncbi:BRCT domain-containing protein [Populus alba x Populus x berolinensis]|uniref:BRCT domain-containing protein n=1 Tax=Populus alba x Populus x berolinensis TaxID=444605 RepID=A0AAD6RHC0_9ROSI|nr:BRCT domain-containing protein [Populus alba x Populus x berolinensis]